VQVCIFASNSWSCANEQLNDVDLLSPMRNVKSQRGIFGAASWAMMI
jgi:hypothetical protein